MADLWSRLGYDLVAEETIRTLRASTGVAVLQGPPGVGKSWLSRGIGALWEAHGGGTVVAEGDSSRTSFPYYPLAFALGGLASGWKDFAPKAAGVARAAEGLAGSSGLVTAVVHAVAAAKKARRPGRKFLLDDTAMDVLDHLERLADHRPILLVGDNLHWWDVASLELLRRFRDPRMQQAYPFLAQLRLLAVQTTEPHQSVANPHAHTALLDPSVTARFELKRIPREGFETVLAELGAGPVSVETGALVYDFCGGHLAVASRAADRIAEGSLNSFIAAADSVDFLRSLMLDRIASLGEVGAKVTYLLQVAAVLGLTFRRDEVACATEVSEGEGARLLRHCRDERLLELSNGTARFVHDLYRQFFLEAADDQRVEIHERLMECLRIFRPGEYELRCLNALRAERTAEAAANAALAALARQRDGLPWRNLSSEVLEVLANTDLLPVVERLEVAWADLNHYRFADCLATIDRLPRALPKPLLAEADYLRAMCLMSTRCEADRAEGRILLQGWSGYVEEEAELGLRLDRLLLYGLAHSVDKSAARELESRIKQVLIDRVGDPSARDDFYTLDRCASSLYQPDVALIRNREAVAHFRPTKGRTVVRRPLEYYRSLVNFGAGLISNALYDEAGAVYSDVERLLEEYGRDVFPRPDYPRMNHVLADYRAELISATEAARRQRQIATSLLVPADPFYILNGLAVFLTLAGEIEESLDIWDRLDAELSGRAREPEPSMVYLIRSNRCGAKLVAGGGGSALQAEWRELEPVLRRVAYNFRDLLFRRHELLVPRMAEKTPISAAALDEYLVTDRFEFGPLWDNFGRGFRMPEVEFWREN